MNLFSPYAKAYIALIGSTATALLAVFASDSDIGKALTVVAVICTAYGAFRVPNAKVVKAGESEPADQPVVVTGLSPEEVADAVAPLDDDGDEPDDLDPAYRDPALRRLQ